MQGIKDLVNSAHGILAIALIAAATVLTMSGQLSVAEWQNYTQWIFGIAVGGHTVISAADSLSKRSTAPNPIQDVLKQVASSTAPVAAASVTATVTKEQQGNA